MDSMAWHGPHIRAQEGMVRTHPTVSTLKVCGTFGKCSSAKRENFNRITFSCCQVIAAQNRRKSLEYRMLTRLWLEHNEHSNTGTKDTETCNGTYGETRNDVEITCLSL